MKTKVAVWLRRLSDDLLGVTCVTNPAIPDGGQVAQTIITITDECIERLRRDRIEHVNNWLTVCYQPTANKAGRQGEGCYVERA